MVINSITLPQLKCPPEKLDLVLIKNYYTKSIPLPANILGLNSGNTNDTNIGS